jgi:acetylglutamate kinase
MDNAIRKAEVLIEALSYIRNFRDKLTVIKLGGSAMEDPEALRATLQDVVFMETVGMRPVLVHGGGKPIDRAMAAAGLVTRKVQGRRYTDDATLAVVVRVLLQEINAGIEAQIRQLGGRAVGAHLGSFQYLRGQRLLLPGDNGKLTDLGRVGQVTQVDTPLIRDVCAAAVSALTFNQPPASSRATDGMIGTTPPAQKSRIKAVSTRVTRPTRPRSIG